jgi:hypothetical protein
MDEYMRSIYIKQYIDTQRMAMKFIKTHRPCPPLVSIRAEKALYMLRKYLDMVGIKMKPPIYIFNYNDEATWKYIPNRRQLSGPTNLLNPDFKYK